MLRVSLGEEHTRSRSRILIIALNARTLHVLQISIPTQNSKSCMWYMRPWKQHIQCFFNHLMCLSLKADYTHSDYIVIQGCNRDDGSKYIVVGGLQSNVTDYCRERQ
jgi:hypothetical protein